MNSFPHFANPRQLSSFLFHFLHQEWRLGGFKWFWVEASSSSSPSSSLSPLLKSLGFPWGEICAKPSHRKRGFDKGASKEASINIACECVSIIDVNGDFFDFGWCIFSLI
eukprot:TRINITY_DN809_c0_g1_i2.p3 TRINITY_DN809_c0_g1~~TRINITY_DN809_c0_g1_i2.p3  ORF type:complete len:110 (-),score=25.84 TRINITY_DN809_c0_g1_i2:754-1083(-)